MKRKQISLEKEPLEDDINIEEEDSDDDFVNANWNTAGVRMSGRNKGKAEAEANRYKGAPSIDNVAGPSKKLKREMDEKNEVVNKRKTKKGESSKVGGTHSFQTRNSPKVVFDTIQTLTPGQKFWIDRMGFGGILDMKLDGIPNKMGFYVVDNFNPITMEIKLGNGSIMITKELISDILGIRNVGIDIMEEDVEKDEEMLRNWKEQYGGEKDVYTGDVKVQIRKSRLADFNFKLNFIVLITSIMGITKRKGVCDESVLDHITSRTDLSSINWCNYIWQCLQRCKENWKRDMVNCFFHGPITFLIMAYVDATVCDGFNVPRVRPPIKFWTIELLRERELQEIANGGIGMGELNGPYIEEDIDTMPDDEEGFIWKLNKIVETIRTNRASFERTLSTGLGLFPGNLLLTDLRQQYKEALVFKKLTDEGTSGTNAANEGGNTGLDDNEIVKYGGTSGGNDQNVGDIFDSPAYKMGPETQADVIATVDRVVSSILGADKEWLNESPSFSLGLTQPSHNAEEKEVDEPSTKQVTKTEDVFGSSSGVNVEPVNAVPLRSLKPVKNRARRVGGLPGCMVSPYYNRILAVDGRYTKEEKAVEAFLTNTTTTDGSEIIFETAYGVRTSMNEMRTLLLGHDVADAVIDGWSAFLNSLEKYKDPHSYSRFYFPTYVVDKKEFTNGEQSTDVLNLYILNVEKLAAQSGKDGMLKNVDIAFIPVRNGQHMFVICMNLKYPNVTIIESNKVKKTGGSVQKLTPLTAISDMTLASIMSLNLGIHMQKVGIANGKEIEVAEVFLPKFSWQTDCKPDDCGVFVMRHMESYTGATIGRWVCGLANEGKKQDNQLTKLRLKYAARMLLAECNVHKDKVAAYLGKTEGQKVAVKMERSTAAMKTRRNP